MLVALAVVACTARSSPSTPPPTLTPSPSPTATRSLDAASSSPTSQPSSAAGGSALPSQLLSTPSLPAATQSVALPVPAVYAHQWLRLDAWAPDGAHLIVDDTGGDHVLDASGNPLWGFDAQEVGWLDSTTIAAAGTHGAGPARETVRFYDLSGTETGSLPDVFESIVVAPDHRVFAGTYPATGDLAQGDRFSIWDGKTVSDPRVGNAQTWSPDGSRLAVLLPPWSPSKPGMDGRLAIVDRTGKQVFILDGWYGWTIGDYEFSPDGRYLAACLTQDRNDIELGAVVDTQTGAVTDLGGSCTAFTWSDGPVLYAPGNPTGGQWLRWTPAGGAVPMDGVASDDVVFAAPNGNLAILSSMNDSVLRLVVNGVVEERTLPGPMWVIPVAVSVSWRPDGQALAVVYARNGEPSGGDLALAIIDI